MQVISALINPGAGERPKLVPPKPYELLLYKLLVLATPDLDSYLSKLPSEFNLSSDKVLNNTPFCAN